MLQSVGLCLVKVITMLIPTICFSQIHFTYNFDGEKPNLANCQAFVLVENDTIAIISDRIDLKVDSSKFLSYEFVKLSIKPDELCLFYDKVRPHILLSDTNDVIEFWYDRKPFWKIESKPNSKFRYGFEYDSRRGDGFGYKVELNKLPKCRNR